MQTTTVSKQFSAFLLAAAIVTFLLLVEGTAVRVLDAGQGCPDWPTCYGQLVPTRIPGDALHPALELQLAHRVLSGLSMLMILVAGIWAARVYSRLRAVTWPLGLAALTLLAQAVLGSLFVAYPQESALLSILHMGVALAALAAIVWAAVAAYYARSTAAASSTGAASSSGAAAIVPGLRSPFARLSLLTLVAVFFLLVSGTLLTATGAGPACAGWPLCDGGLPQDGLAWLAFSHRIVVAGASLLVLVQFLSAWRAQRSQPVLLPAATGVFLLALGLIFIGAVKVTRGYPLDLVALHASAAAGLWALQVLLVGAAYFVNRSAVQEQLEAAEPLPIRERLRDFFILSQADHRRAAAGHHLCRHGRRRPPDPCAASLAFWTMLGGALAAGGASRSTSISTARPTKICSAPPNARCPTSACKPPEGLAYGLGACLAAFFLLAGMVNLLAAVLSLAGMIYYVLIYSVWLKHVTVQNIVIGGGAGAIPPLVGWAAATGSLNVPALFLFAIIFFWTPPHFWALALVRRSDYARGRVPMLPVIRGETETRKQILIYTFELVALTLLLPIFNMAGTVYLVSALALGLWLIHTAWKVYKNDGNKVAWKMYRYSSMYLMFLMIAMVIDVLV
jgi:heme o synthase